MVVVRHVPLLSGPFPMPLNIPGLLAPFQLVWNTRVILPHVIMDLTIQRLGHAVTPET